ncbi:genetic competence negative regulator [Pseudalkalibacillus salsuginis]|uniref:genetic competence negative regulator n=1 Tax=Pseudalkalibacillus salsuginis TaxID=2910972 RepID=UPI001F2CCD28|nr:genetic competence negative regulator [Pseudalkalibacillus salsuginis]MCF6408256.1 genetic competence negative regulator [Pseudalkalibacillus salsuginis]
MRLERLTYNKIKVFLTLDDLDDRGISKEEMWQDLPKVHELFRDMMLEADDELGFKADGPIAVEVFSLPAQGMVVIVTKGQATSEDEDYDDEYLELQVTMDISDDIIYEFKGFDDIVALASRVYQLGITGGEITYYNGHYYISFEEEEYELLDVDMFVALLSEFGSPSTITKWRVKEYGKLIMEVNAMEQVNKYFLKK